MCNAFGPAKVNGNVNEFRICSERVYSIYCTASCVRSLAVPWESCPPRVAPIANTSLRVSISLFPVLQVVDAKVVLNRVGSRIVGNTPNRIAECTVGDETGVIVLTARNEQGEPLTCLGIIPASLTSSTLKVPMDCSGHCKARKQYCHSQRQNRHVSRLYAFGGEPVGQG